MDGDIVEVMQAVIAGGLAPSSVRARAGAAACVVMASGGYPGSYEKGKRISGLADAAGMEGVTLFHAGTARADGDTVTSGGRVLGVTGVGDDLPRALGRAYAGARAIHFDGAHHRTDIGFRALARIGPGGAP
jgi:phosphoribosylamine--glycine ligase